MTIYHPGEVEVQRRAGLESAASSSGRAIKDTIPPIAAEFLAAQPMVVIGGTDRHGQVWSSLLTGPAGFMRAADEHTLAVEALPGPHDPLAELLSDQAHVGMIAIEPATRRRMRMNGTANPEGGGLRVNLGQVLANCPKYLQKRKLTVPATGAGPTGETSASRQPALTAAQQLRITTADTFFVATADERGNADASHRGGNPGFVEVLSPTKLRWPEYAGNAMFMTLGNLLVNPKAGLLIPDWDSGSFLHLTGTASTDWNPEHAAQVPGAQRLVEFDITEVVEVSGASPLRWSAPEYSRFNPAL
ncbi:pyridoxamine 5'-phosphate oxidase family protein [Streptomyces sp. NPDC094149]|uniref:pyridoxamine 5'-phosphate oxidase family protein n=1 Tax=Streptomyces sp. NPDC094149 TaxID=3155079 RepID=UPI00331E371D